MCMRALEIEGAKLTWIVIWMSWEFYNGENTKETCLEKGR